MNRRARILLALIPAALGLAQTMSRNVYLPMRYEREDSQVVHLQLHGVIRPVQVKHPCYVGMTNDLVMPTGNQLDLCFYVDLRQAKENFVIQLRPPDTEKVETELLLHLSLVPFRFQTTISGDQFSVTNLSSTPMKVESSQNVRILEADDNLIRGTFVSPGALRLAGQEQILLKHQNKSQ